MVELWIGNVESSVPDEDIKEFLTKYGFPEFNAVKHVPGDESRPAVVLTFNDGTPEELRRLQPRIHNLFWKNRKINVHVISGAFT